MTNKPTPPQLARTVQLADLLLRDEGPDAPKTGPNADYVRIGSTYYGKPDRPVHVITSRDRPLHLGGSPTLCGRSTDAGWEFGPDSAVTCRVCARRLAALRATEPPTATPRKTEQ